MRSTPFRAVCALFLLTAMAGCRKEKPPEEQGTAGPPQARPNVLKDIPVFPNSRLIDTTNAEEAQQGTWRSIFAVDSVTSYYRTQLPPLGWRVMNDQRDIDKHDLYLRKDSVALWVHVEKKAPVGSMFTLIATLSSSRASNPHMAQPAVR
jgi:hypothetical protein